MQNTDKEQKKTRLTDISKVLYHFDAIDIYPSIDIVLTMVLSVLLDISKRGQVRKMELSEMGLRAKVCPRKVF